MEGIHVDGVVLAFAATLALCTGILFSLAPMLLTMRRDLTTPLNERGGRSGQAGVRHRLRATLVITEIAVALVLVTAGGLLTRSFTRVLAIDAGFQADHVLTADVFLRRSRYPDAASATAFFGRVAEQVRALPGVQSVGVTNALPLRGFAVTFDLHRPGDDGVVPSVAIATVSHDYFRAFRIAAAAGRLFDSTDRHGSPTGIVLSATAARLLFPTGGAVGAPIAIPDVGDGKPVVIGVAKDVPQRDLLQASMAQVYLSLEQSDDGYPYSVVVRTAGEPAALAPALRRAVLGVDPLQPVEQIRTMDDQVAEVVAPRRFTSLLIDIFAGLALFLASIGLYGVMAYQVAQRTRELGVRIAFGADARSVLALVLRRGAALAAVGIAGGVVLSLALTRLLADLLYQVSVRDPLTFVGAPLVLLLVAAFACVVPGRRATRVDLMVALRNE